jgi:energy-coupling factor transporter transmembrane protein EcfT
MASIPPRPRLFATVIALVAIFIANHWLPLTIALLVVLALLASADLAAVFLKFFLVTILPTSVILVLVGRYITRAPLGEPMGSDPIGGAVYGAIVALRLATLGAVLQLAMLSVPARKLPWTLRGFGVRGEGMVVALGVFAVGPELLLRAEQVIIARRARGLAGGGVLARASEMARMLRPLFVWSIRSAVHRSEAWHQRAMLLKVENLPQESADFSPTAGVAAVALSVVWLWAAMWSRWSGWL